jgi:hypothetical protein
MSQGLLDAIVEALVQACASPEAINAAVGAYEVLLLVQFGVAGGERATSPGLSKPSQIDHNSREGALE